MEWLSKEQMQDFSTEFEFIASRSSGPGGQSVNKVSSKVELRFHIENSQLLSEEQKNLIKEKCGAKITLDGFLRIVSQTERSQLKNKENCILKFYAFLEKCFQKKKKRKPTKPSAAAKAKRLETKKKTALKKIDRKKISE